VRNAISASRSCQWVLHREHRGLTRGDSRDFGGTARSDASARAADAAACAREVNFWSELPSLARKPVIHERPSFAGAVVLTVRLLASPRSPVVCMLRDRTWTSGGVGCDSEFWLSFFWARRSRYQQMAAPQSTFGSIVGTVQDKSNSVIPAASVCPTNTNLDENTNCETASNAQGAYEFLNVAPGRYSLVDAASATVPSKLVNTTSPPLTSDASRWPSPWPAHVPTASLARLRRSARHFGSRPPPEPRLRQAWQFCAALGRWSATSDAGGAQRRPAATVARRLGAYGTSGCQVRKRQRFSGSR
jgi:hypothetical protein